MDMVPIRRIHKICLQSDPPFSVISYIFVKERLQKCRTHEKLTKKSRIVYCGVPVICPLFAGN